ncbi:chromosome segregation protein [Carpediemonas membranifera]|uniref:Chromosome segregation protein n=1 Tax=Carpediemonas membranifera TaxID=201153 RepID=A0A8J6E267_9EUKA|nr:chromosome segregation protein [Carpediemonas membranifera]|eukprot:KAG9391522.1 chromosome segregation protein [Carpediemonas membranifera]
MVTTFQNPSTGASFSLSDARAMLVEKKKRTNELERMVASLKNDLADRERDIRHKIRPRTPGHPLKSKLSSIVPSTPNMENTRDQLMETPVFQKLQGQLRSMRKANQMLEKKLTSDLNIVVEKLRNELKAAVDAKEGLEQELTDVEGQKSRANDELSRQLGDESTGILKVERLKGEITFLQTEAGRLQRELDATQKLMSERENHDIHMARVLGAIWTNIKSRTARPKEEWDEDVKDVTRRVNRLLDSLEQENAMLSAAKLNIEAEVVEMAEALEVLVRERDVAQRAREADKRKAGQAIGDMRRRIATLESARAGLEEQLTTVKRVYSIASTKAKERARQSIGDTMVC